MKSNKYIDKEINNTINSFLIKEGFYDNLKSRVKNGLEGFDVGGNYQRNIDTYADNNFSKIIETINNATTFFDKYKKYFDTYNGKNKNMMELKSEMNYLIRLMNDLKDIYDSKMPVVEGIGNRLNGFVNGFRNNKNYEREYDDNGMSEELNELFNEHIKPLCRNIMYNVKELLKTYKTNQKFCSSLENFQNGINYVLNYIQKNLYYNRENHSKMTDLGYKFGRGMSKMPSKMEKGFKTLADYGDKYDPFAVSDNQEIVPNKLKDFGRNIRGKISKYARDNFGNEKVDNFKNWLKSYTDEDEEV